MRRITAKYAQRGMVLGMPVYDLRGNQLLSLNTKLDDRCLRVMLQNSITEIYVKDARMADIIVAPMFSPELDSTLASAFRELLEENGGKPTFKDSLLDNIFGIVYNMTTNLAMNFLGEINVSGCVSQQDYQILQPVKASELAMGIGHKLKMPNQDLITLGVAALLKDIGFTQLPPEIFNAPESLTPEGLRRMREHPGIGHRILKQHNRTRDVIADIVLQHHEFWNGSGCPQGLKGEQISNFAQIITIADTFSDLTAERPGRGKYMSHEAIEYIMAFSGDQFNPTLAEFTVRNIPSYPNGLTVQLNTGEIAMVSVPNLGFIARPVVRVFYDPIKGILEEPWDMDLSQSEFQHKLISKVLEYD